MLARWAGFLGAFLVIGATVFRFAVIRGWTRAHPGDAPVAEVLAVRAARLGLLGAMGLALVAGMKLWFQARTFVEPGEAIEAELVRFLIAETAWGRGWMAQLGASVLALGGFLATLAVPRLGWIGAGLGATAVALAAPLTGHAVSEVAGSSGVLVDALHLLGGSAWLGTLLVTTVAGLTALARLGPEQRGRLVARLITAFSPVALVGATVAIAAGLLLSWRYLGDSLAARWGALVGSEYGRALLIKTLALLVVTGVGAWNWRVVLPRLGTSEGAERLGRSARLEIVFAVILLFVTAVLVALPMPAEAGGAD